MCQNMKYHLRSTTIFFMKEILSLKITFKTIDDIYQLGINNGAGGGKVLGAGGGGFMLFYSEEKYHQKIRKALSNLKELNFKFENSGSKIIYVGDILKEKIWRK